MIMIFMNMMTMRFYDDGAIFYTMCFTVQHKAIVTIFIIFNHHHIVIPIISTITVIIYIKTFPKAPSPSTGPSSSKSLGNSHSWSRANSYLVSMIIVIKYDNNFDFDFHDDFITMDMMDNKNVLTPKDNPRSLQCPSTLASPFGSFLFEPVHVHCLSMMNRH